MNGEQRRTALVLYGTETGTSQDLAEELSHILERQLFETLVKGLDTIHPVCHHPSYHFKACTHVSRINCLLILLLSSLSPQQAKGISLPIPRGSGRICSKRDWAPSISNESSMLLSDLEIALIQSKGRSSLERINFLIQPQVQLGGKETREAPSAVGCHGSPRFL